MKAEDINFNDSYDDQDDIMTLTKKIIDLEALVQKLEDIAKAQDEALEMAQQIQELLKMKEFALKMYIKSLEDELDIDKDEEE